VRACKVGNIGGGQPLDFGAQRRGFVSIVGLRDLVVERDGGQPHHAIVDGRPPAYAAATERLFRRL
jgi:hypothetical protein